MPQTLQEWEAENRKADENTARVVDKRSGTHVKPRRELTPRERTGCEQHTHLSALWYPPKIVVDGDEKVPHV